MTGDTASDRDDAEFEERIKARVEADREILKRLEEPEAVIYRVLFETVNLPALRKYCNADPAMFKNTTQTVPNSQIPDEDWHPVQGRATDNPWQQYSQLRQWEAQDREFVRNVRLEKMISEPQWEEVKRT